MVKKALLSPPSNVNVQRARLKFVKKHLSLTVKRFSFLDERPKLNIYIYIFFQLLDLRNDIVWGSKWLLRTRMG